MYLLKLTIENEDRSFTWLFDAFDDKTECICKALDELIANHGFFQENEVCTRFPAHFEPDDETYGFLVLAGERLDLEDAIDDPNTYWILCEDYKIGTLLQESRRLWTR